MKLPAPSDEFLRQTFRILEQEDGRNYKTNKDLEIANNSIILMSPNGTRYKIVVSDLGVLSAVAV